MNTAQDQQSRAEFIKHVLAPNGIYERGIGWVAINSAGEFQVPETLERWVDWQAAWQAARALPAGVEPVAWLHINRLGASQTFTSEPPPGFKAQCAPLYTAAQVQAMGRVPPLVAPFTSSLMLDDGGERPFYCVMAAYLAEADARNALAMLAAPRPPAAQERKPLTDEQISDMRGADLGRLNFVTLREFRTVARAVEAAHGIKEASHGQQT